MDKLTCEKIYAALGTHELPNWDELPDFDLYMDQVLSLVGRYLKRLPDSDERPLTSSMVNNYVKMKVMPAPVSKKYSRVHIACLIIICILKSTFPISAVQQLLKGLQSEEDVHSFYEHFCDIYRQTNRELAQFADREEAGVTALILRAALRSQAEQAAALALLSSQCTE